MPQLSSQTRQLIATAAILAWGHLPGELASGTPARIREAMRRDLPSRADYERMERGYYEQLLDAGRSLGAVADGPGAGERKGWTHLEVAPFEAGPLCLVVDDVREFVLKPSLSYIHDGATWSTNALGMRDRSYEKAKPPGTFRIAFVGDSIGAGWGVNDGEGFEPLLEQALDERSKGAGGPPVEVLNFAVPGHGPGQRWEHFTRFGWGMEPDLVLFESTAADPGWDERRLRGLLPRGIGWDVPYYRDILAGAKLQPGGTFETYKQALRPFRWEFLAAVYRAVVADCRARGVPCVLVLIPRVGKRAEPAEHQRLLALAGDAGFAQVVDLSDAYDGLDPKDLAISPDDYHPNADGHARLARRLDAELCRLPELRRRTSEANEEADLR
jgi:hypothetical protein